MLMNNLIDDNGYLVGITCDEGIEVPVKPTFNDETAQFINGKWEYKFNDLPQIKIVEDETLIFYNQLITILSNINKIRPIVGTKTIEHSDDISVLIPCYGKAKYVSQAVKSCINQTLQPKEVIIFLMDEESQKLKDELENISPLITCYNKERMNASKARNELVKICKTDWFIFLDADDYFLPDYIETLRNMDGAICSGVMHRINDITGEDVGFEISTLFEANNHPVKVLPQNLTCLIHKEVFNEYPLEEKFCLGGEDLDFFLNVFEDRKWKISFTQKSGFIYRYNAQNNLSKQESFAESLFEVIKRHKQFYLDELSSLRYLSSNMISIWFLKNMTRENCGVFYTCLSKEIKLSHCNTLSIHKIVDLINKSKYIEPKTKYSEDDFIFVNSKPSFLYEGKCFDVLFLDFNLGNSIKDINIGTSYIINKEVLQDVESKNLDGLNKLIYLLKNYSCFINPIKMNFNNSYEFNSDDLVKLLDVDFDEEINKDIEDVYNTIFADTFLSLTDVKKRKITFILNKKCNLRCKYCSNTEGNISDEEIFANFDRNLTKIEQMTNGKIYLQIMGGEPTIWSDWLTDKVIERISNYRDVFIFTNGTNRKSKFYSCNNVILITHITDWRNNDYEHYTRLDNELFTVVYEHNCLDEMERFIKTIPTIELDTISINPCFGNSDASCDEKDLEDLYNLSKKYQTNMSYTKLYEQRKNMGIVKFNELCNNSLGVWQLDCNTNKISPCCDCREIYDINEFKGIEKVKNCDGCINFGNIMQ